MYVNTRMHTNRGLIKPNFQGHGNREKEQMWEIGVEKGLMRR